MNAAKAALIICGLESCTDEQRATIEEALSQVKEDYGIEVADIKDFVEPAKPLLVEEDIHQFHPYYNAPKIENPKVYTTTSPRDFGMAYIGSSKYRNNKKRRK